MIVHRRLVLGLAALGIAALALSSLAPMAGHAQSASQPQAKELVIFAAASLKNALDDIAAGWARAAGRPMPKISYAASSALARQIEQGAPADLFFSADLDWMDYAAAKSLIRPETRVNLLGNRIALVGPKESKAELVLAPGIDLAGALNGGRLAMGNVDSVPAGKYGKAALETLGAWEGVKDRIAQTDNVRAALLLVSRGEAPLGIVYTTDAASDPNVRIVATFPETSHPPILYPVAATKDGVNADTAGFLAYLRGAGAAAVFVRHGFAILNKPAQGS